MTAEERYKRFQIHNASATRPWSALYHEDREAWESFNEEIESEKNDAVRRAVIDYKRVELLHEEADLEASGMDCYGSVE